MKDFKRCPKCNEWHWTSEECDPSYNVFHEDYMGDEPKVFHANSHEAAALGYGRYYNQNCDYPLTSGDTIDVKVEKDGVVKWFRIGAEPDINYTSNEIEAPE